VYFTDSKVIICINAWVVRVLIGLVPHGYFTECQVIGYVAAVGVGWMLYVYFTNNHEVRVSRGVATGD
jgi:hypothetical protein